jgi:hypothetical protein
MNILMITENDPAGMGIAFTNAINRYSEHTCRLITTATRYNFGTEKDLHVPALDEEGFGEISELLKKADILHFHQLADENTELGPIRTKEFIAGKAILHHHHGHPDFRSHPNKYREKYDRLRRKALVSTPDLLKLLPEAVWQPNLVPINAPNYQPRSIETKTRVRVCQAPTRKDLKNTAEFEVVIASLERKYKNVEGIVIAKTRHEECLRIKQSCVIHFDHMQGYYGVSSLESLSQGKPVIAGLDEWNLKCIKEFSGCGDVPWVIARNRDELEDRLEELIGDDGFRNRSGVASRRFMERYWTEQHVLNILMETYKTL